MSNRKLHLFNLMVAEGNIAGHSFVHKFGYNSEVDTATDPETVWSYGGLYPWSDLDNASPHFLFIKSGSASDTMSVTFQGVDGSGVLISDTVTLNGTTAVQSNRTFKRVFRAYTNSVANVGNITFHLVNGTGTVVCHIPAGEAQTLMAVYTVPAGKTGFLYTCDCSTNHFKSMTIKFYVRFPNAPFRIAHVVELTGASYRYDFPFPVTLPAGTDIEVRADNVMENNTRVSANFDILLVDD